MPFLITTTRPEDGEFLNPVNGQSEPYGQANVVSRRAVATLEEAATIPGDAIRQWRDAVPSREKWNAAYELLRAAENLPESGGTVSLPDGTTIEVEPISWRDLRIAAGYEEIHSDTGRKIVAAYNAAQETSPCG